jgi:hypothetical protein
MAALRVWIRTTTKDGRDRPEDNEDHALADRLSGRFAVADGASTSARADIWARLLTESFVLDRADPLDPTVLHELRKRWWDQAYRPDLPWYALQKVVAGAAATFLGLVIADGCYQFVAVGDSCLFHVREGELLLAGPLNQAAQFGNTPELVSSLHELPALREHQWNGGGSYRQGDHFLLATDAIAHHVLSTPNDHRSLSSAVEAAYDPDLFAALVAKQRQHGRNDDATICVVSV